MINLKAKLNTLTYLCLTAGVAVAFVLTAIPQEYLCKTVYIPGVEIFVGSGDMKRYFLIMFPIISIVGALTTLRKKKTIEDVFINLAWPLSFLLLVQLLETYTIACLVVMLVVALLGIAKIKKTMRTACLHIEQKFRYTYYRCRKLVYIMLLLLSPLAIYNQQKWEKREQELMRFYEGCVENVNEKGNEEELHLISQEEWNELEIQGRIDQMAILAKYYCKELGTEEIPVYAGVLEYGTRGLYTSGENPAIYISMSVLEDYGIDKAAECLLHEVHHHYQHAVIDTLLELKKANVNFWELKYYQDAIGLAAAKSNYGKDSLSMDTYLENEMEVQSRTYAEEQVELLREKFGWEVSEEEEW